ncbi:MAG: 4Fe-4S dicluster domain-containing protein [Candidatus Bathyarchaeia archaeon]
MVRWVLVVDLRKCIGCNTCTVACKIENFTPKDVFWIKVLKGEKDGKRISIPMQCMHCKTPPCLKVCPVEAITRRDDGIVIIDQTRCIGCKNCIAACPYGAPQFLDKIEPYFPIGFTPWEAYGLKNNQRIFHNIGIVEKCTFCYHRIDEGLRRGLKPGVDREATPVCVNLCPTSARYFGDLEDPNSEVSRLLATRKFFRIREELQTEPSIYYLT